jgi:hypothetical protein
VSDWWAKKLGNLPQQQQQQHVVPDPGYRPTPQYVPPPASTPTPGVGYVQPQVDWDQVDTSQMSINEKHEVLWKRMVNAPARGRGEAAKNGEDQECPQCGSANYFVRKKNSRDGKLPAPMCMACSYTGDSYSLSSLN